MRKTNWVGKKEGGISRKIKKKMVKGHLAVGSKEIKKGCKENWNRAWLVMGTCRAEEEKEKQISFSHFKREER